MVDPENAEVEGQNREFGEHDRPEIEDVDGNLHLKFAVSFDSSCAGLFIDLPMSIGTSCPDHCPMYDDRIHKHRPLETIVRALKTMVFN